MRQSFETVTPCGCKLAGNWSDSLPGYLIDQLDFIRSVKRPDGGGLTVVFAKCAGRKRWTRREVAYAFHPESPHIVLVFGHYGPFSDSVRPLSEFSADWAKREATA